MDGVWDGWVGGMFDIGVFGGDGRNADGMAWDGLND
jgi:hypothetical protein